MKWAQIALLCVYGFALLWAAYSHGKTKPEKTENFWTDAIAMLIGFGLAYLAGAFNKLF